MAGYPLQSVIRLTKKGTANAEVKLELAKPSAELRYRLLYVLVSFGGSGTVTPAILTIEDGMKAANSSETEAEKVEHFIAAKGLVWIPLDWRTPNAVTVKLAAGGSEVTGALTLVYSI